MREQGNKLLPYITNSTSSLYTLWNYRCSGHTISIAILGKLSKKSFPLAASISIKCRPVGYRNEENDMSFIRATSKRRSQETPMYTAPVMLVLAQAVLYHVLSRRCVLLSSVRYCSRSQGGAFIDDSKHITPICKQTEKHIFAQS